jgi:hypothetical protein
VAVYVSPNVERNRFSEHGITASPALPRVAIADVLTKQPPHLA